MSQTIAELEAALNASPDNWSARRALAEAQLAEGQQVAAAHLLMAAPMVPGDEDNLMFTAYTIAHTAEGWEPAQGLLEDYLKAHPESSAAHLTFGRLLLGRGDTAGAESHFKVAAVLDPSIQVDAEMQAPVGVHAIHLQGEGPHHGERMLIVGEGEAVHAADKKSDTNEKVGALAAAIAVHAAIIFLLGLVALTVPVSAPPQLSVSSVSGEESSTVENVQLNKVSRKTSATMSQSTPIVSVEAFSPTAVPQIVDPNNTFSMIGATGDSGDFGMSMSGFGDVSNMGAIPAQMRSRCSASQRLKRLRESGGDERAEAAVKKALDFIASKQNADGSWGKEFKYASTGLALLSFLGHCETPESAKYGDSVVNGTLFLMETAKKNKGKMATEGAGNHHSYEHAIATYALCELYTMTKESGREIPRLENTLRDAVGIIVDGQDKAGGWVYGYANGGNNPDMSVSGWQIQALKAAHNTGKKFSGVDRALDKAISYVKKAQDDKNGGWKYRLVGEESTGKPTLTGAGILALQIWNEGDSDHVKKGLDFLDKNYLGRPPGADFYAPYYNMQAYFMEGGTRWETFNSKFQKALLDAQNADGSWTKGDAKDSLIRNTAWGALMLEVYYRYLPTSDKVQGLKVR